MTARIITTLAICLALLGDLPAVDPLAGTSPLTETRPLDEVMVEGIDRIRHRTAGRSPEITTPSERANSTAIPASHWCR